MPLSFLKGSDFFASFDTDGDGVISFSEYQLILMLLAIPLEARQKYMSAGKLLCRHLPAQNVSPLH